MLVPTYISFQIKIRVSFQYLHNGVWYHPEIRKFESWAKLHDRHSWVKRHYLSTQGPWKFQEVNYNWKEEILPNVGQNRLESTNRNVQTRSLPIWLQSLPLSLDLKSNMDQICFFRLNPRRVGKGVSDRNPLLW